MGVVMVRRRLVGHALVEVLSRAFYALRDTRTPVTVGVIAVVVAVSMIGQVIERTIRLAGSLTGYPETGRAPA